MGIPPAELLAAMGGIIGGLLVMVVCVLTGTRIVRWLKLPQELPEGPLFEPPPPPIRSKPDRKQAHEMAALQQRLRTIYESGHSTMRAAQQIQEHLFALERAGHALTGEEERKTHATVTARVEQASKRASDAATKAEQAMRHADPARAERETTALLSEARAALSEVEAAMRQIDIPDASRRLYVILLVAFLISLLLLVVSWSMAHK
jgi:hypothetical protein